MVDGFPRVLIVVAAVGSGLVAGVFFAFSTFVMPAIRRRPAPAAIAVMQEINLAAPNPLFMLALLGTALTSVGVAVTAVVDLGEPFAPFALAGAALYLVTIVLTATYHVPRNNALAGVDPDAGDAAEVWARYAAEWTRWNHVRTIAPLAAAVAFTLGAARHLSRAEPSDDVSSCPARGRKRSTSAASSSPERSSSPPASSSSGLVGGVVEPLELGDHRLVLVVAVDELVEALALDDASRAARPPRP